MKGGYNAWMRELTRRDLLKTAAGAGAAAMCAASAAQAPTSRPLLPLRTLGRTGVKVPILGLGGAGFLVEMKDKDQIEQLLHEAVASGITYFDTAPSYGAGRSQENLGLLMGTRQRDGLFLASKTDDRTHDGAMRQIEQSLRRLRTDRMDLVQVHHVYNVDDVKAFGAKGGVLTALHRLRDQKVVRFIGMTGHPEYPQVKEALEAYDFDTLLCFVNPRKASEPAIKEQLPLARKKSMGVVAMKVFGGSTPAAIVGEGPGRALAADLLRYALSQDIDIAIPAVSSRQQLAENVQVAGSFKPMTAQEQDRIVAQVNRRAED